ncbi:MAG: hypothetical protein NVV59_10370 [Chitinophagaceae bacterium]|nr:hypothetical protein [Chitinophagaceae bacterium]
MLPDPDDAAALYAALPEGERYKGFWTRVWPSALALSEYIVNNPEHTTNKRVWEIAAGLGVPSLFAAKNASSVICSDYIGDAVDNMVESARLNNFKNFEAIEWDFTKEDIRPECDTVLISDANYDGNQNQELASLILDELKKGRTIILSTPNRLSGMGFLDAILPYCFYKSVNENSGVFAAALGGNV